jgi:predicted AlkP superfamily phosphohydrolase/phosphomutase
LRRAVYLNRYLEQGGFVSLPAPTRGTEGLAHQLKRALGVAKRFLPADAVGWLRREAGSLRDQLESALVENLCDWARTRLYSVGSCGHIYVNLRGREPHGQVAPGAEYDRLLRAATDHLLALRDPQDGQAVIERVWQREELYHGPALARAPDLVLSWRDDAYEPRPALGAPGLPVFQDRVGLSEFVATPLTGCHRRDGILLAYGAGIEPGPVMDGSILDLAPTILYALGLSVPREMDGRILDRLVTPQPPIREAVS